MTEGLRFENLLPNPPAVLTVFADGNVESYETVLPAGAGLIEVINADGINYVDFGIPTRIDLMDADPNFDAEFGLLSYSGSNTAFLTNTAYQQSLTQFSGTLFLVNSALQGTGIQTQIGGTSSGQASTVIGSDAIIEIAGPAGSRGVRSFADILTTNSSANVVLAPRSTLMVTGDAAQGAVAEVYAATGDADVVADGAVSVVGANGAYAQYGVYAYSAGGAATVNVGGTVDLSPGTGTVPLSPTGSSAVRAVSESATSAATVMLGAAATVTAAGQQVFGLQA
ncbi:MAG: hypothetical protein ABI859_20665, partial [Pseudomonadota bacterium]